MVNPTKTDSSGREYFADMKSNNLSPKFVKKRNYQEFAKDKEKRAPIPSSFEYPLKWKHERNFKPPTHRQNKAGRKKKGYQDKINIRKNFKEIMNNLTEDSHENDVNLLAKISEAFPSKIRDALQPSRYMVISQLASTKKKAWSPFNIPADFKDRTTGLPYNKTLEQVLYENTTIVREWFRHWRIYLQKESYINPITVFGKKYEEFKQEEKKILENNKNEDNNNNMKTKKVLEGIDSTSSFSEEMDLIIPETPNEEIESIISETADERMEPFEVSPLTQYL